MEAVSWRECLAAEDELDLEAEEQAVGTPLLGMWG